MLPPVIKGLLLGIANTLVIAVTNALAAATNTEVGWGRSLSGGPHDPLELFLLVIVFGIFPAMCIGAFVGWMAGGLHWRPAARLVFLALPAVALVCLLGAATRSLELIALSCIPTLAATSILERWTRTRSEPLVPAARAS